MWKTHGLSRTMIYTLVGLEGNGPMDVFLG
jgi:hypothetical protein